ncbi:hypothetical protein NQZ68_025827 [Dissostichus eleginoides]|nr:hypothetical protein NQZ68_025827 [Dissostichus eleginoides]
MQAFTGLRGHKEEEEEEEEEEWAEKLDTPSRRKGRLPQKSEDMIACGRCPAPLPLQKPRDVTASCIDASHTYQGRLKDGGGEKRDKIKKKESSRACTVTCGERVLEQSH